MVYPNSSRGRNLRLTGVLFMLVSIALGSSVGIPMWFGRADITLTSAARLLVSDLSELRERSSYLFVDLQISFDEDGSGYSLSDANNVPLSAPIGPGPFFREYDRDAVFRGVRVSGLEIDGTNKRHLRVAPNGAFADFARIELSFKDQHHTITVDPATGRITRRAGPLEATAD